MTRPPAPEPVCPAYAVAPFGPEIVAALSPRARAVMPFVLDVLLRPEQVFPSHDWRTCGFICGRGWGKSHAIAAQINRKVERGEIKSLALAGPDEDRVRDVQIKFLIATSPPWFKARAEGDTVIWPNGVRADVFSSKGDVEKPRSGNYDFSWCSEIVAWSPTKGPEVYANLATATRRGAAQIVWDTTSKGKNALILAFEADHRDNPRAHVIIRGTTFDNPMLSAKYLEDECKRYRGRRFDEELLGRVFEEAAGALWNAALIDDTKRPTRPDRPELTLVAIDPAMSTAPGADEFGIAVGDRGRDGHVYTHADESGRHEPETWAKIVVDWCEREAAGVVIETNRGGNAWTAVIRGEALARGMVVEVLPRTAKRFPSRRPGTIYVREVHTAFTKGERASGPANEYAAGRAHLVGEHPELEVEMTTFVPGTRKSPNRFDAHAYLVTELAGLDHDDHRGREKEATAAAAKANDDLQARLRAANRGRGVGM